MSEAAATAGGASLRFEVDTPSGPVLSGSCDAVTLPAAAGSVGILPGHTPYLAALSTGVAVFHAGAGETRVFVSRGFVEVMADRVIVLAEIAEKAADVDVARAADSFRRARARLDVSSSSAVMDPESRGRARRARERALHRLKAAGQPVPE